jgi:hypothetical protein
VSVDLRILIGYSTIKTGTNILALWPNKALKVLSWVNGLWTRGIVELNSEYRCTSGIAWVLAWYTGASIWVQLRNGAFWLGHTQWYWVQWFVVESQNVWTQTLQIFYAKEPRGNQTACFGVQTSETYYRRGKTATFIRIFVCKIRKLQMSLFLYFPNCI